MLGALCSGLARVWQEPQLACLEVTQASNLAVNLEVSSVRKSLVSRISGHLSIFQTWFRAGSGFGSRLRMILVGHPALRKRFKGMIGVKSRLTGAAPIWFDSGSVDHLCIVEEVIVNEVYDFRSVDFVPDLVVDCGAHIGLFSRVAACSYPAAQIVAFEPHPDNLTWLRRQFEILRGRGEIVAAAVSDSAGTVVLRGNGCGGTVLDLRVLSEQAAISVPMVRLRDWLQARLQSAKTVLIKSDIEGAEFLLVPDILPILPKICAIFIETHGYGGKEEDLISALVRQEFSVTRLRGREVAGVYYSDLLAIRNRTAAESC